MKILIHSFFSQLKRFTLYRKLVLSFMTLLAVFSLLIVTMLYTLFSHVMHQEYKYMAQNSLVSADSVLLNSYDKLSGVINEVLSLNNLSVFFLRDEADRANEANIFLELRRLKNLYPYIEKISLINLSGNRYLGTDGASDQVDDSIVEHYEQSGAGGLVSFRRTIPEKIRLTNSPCTEVTTFVFFPSGQYRDSAIVLDLKDSYFIDLLNPAALQPLDQIFLVTNESVLIGRTDLPEIDWRPILEGIEEDNFRIMDIENTRCAVTAKQACIPGWKMVRLMPMAGSGILTRKFSLQLGAALFIFLLAVLYGIWLMIRRIYAPVKTMVREQVDGYDTGTVDEIGVICEELVKRSYEIERLNSRLTHSQPLFNGSWVKSQLLGDMETAKRVEKLALEQGMRAPESPYKCAVVLAVDRYQTYNSTVDVGERGLHDFAVSNILSELLGGRILGVLIRMDEQKLACMVACPAGSIDDEILEALKLFQKNFYEFFKYSVSIGLGIPAAAPEDMAVSYRQACSALNYRFYRGTGSLNPYVREWETKRSAYPVKEEREILEAILLQDSKALEKAVNGFRQSLGTPEETRIKGYMERCINSLVSGLAARSVIVEHQDIHGEVFGTDTEKELADVFAQWCETMMKRCGEEQKKDRPGEGNPIAFAQNYIQENYSRADLSVEYLARLVDLSPAYFGKQFYSTLRVSCSDYIADVRLENAAKLLRETSLPVQEISERVGVGSINYFYRLFKKKYGETPVNYRKKQTKQNF